MDPRGRGPYSTPEMPCRGSRGTRPVDGEFSERDLKAELESPEGLSAQAEAAFAWCLDHARRAERDGNPEHAARWARVAGLTAFEYGHPFLMSEPLEALLVRLGNDTRVQTEPMTARQAGHLRRWLHVFTTTGIVGGHAALARRWLEHNPFSERHDVVLTQQQAPAVQTGLAKAAARTGGQVHSLSGEPSLLARARRLRLMAGEADVVVLHIHPFDVVPTIAFAAPGGPPVLLLNHADHAFWVGAAACDIIVDIRDSGQHLTRTLRGTGRSEILPIPLVDPGEARASRSVAAARLGVPELLERRLVLVSIGSGLKYRAIQGLDFLDAVEQIAGCVPDSAIIVVGPSPEAPAWRGLHDRTRGRVRAMGIDPDLRPWHEAMDVYLEGFPIGSYTALLEVALAGRPFVRKPYLVSPSVLPVDRGALAEFSPPETPEAYVAAAVALCKDPAARDAQARHARESVLAVHCGEGWAKRLEQLRKQVPARHEPTGAMAAPRLPAELSAYWERYHSAQAGKGPMAYAKNEGARLSLSADGQLLLRNLGMRRFLRKAPNREFVFIHINKTAGTSIGERLGIRRQSHFTVKEALAGIGLEKWKRAYTFSVVRNPWDKVLSQYRYRVAVNKDGLGEGRLSFTEWVERVYGDPIDLVYHNEPRVFMCQSDWLKTDEGKIDLDFIARFENLSADFRTIAGVLGVEPTLPVRNARPAADYHAWYDARAAERVARWFQEDIERFGYFY
jgi:hypothetical protein